MLTNKLDILPKLFKLSDCYEFWRASQNYGHYLSLVYGDYTQEIRALADMMKFDIELVV